MKSKNVVKIIRAIVIIAFIIGIVIGDGFSKLALSILLWITLLGMDNIIK